ncbi:MAG: ribosome biogenesis GTPase Der [Firmicutes bacterium]|nr:ribosome biogenesis GTPase Der [Bacillota bacterium]
MNKPLVAIVGRPNVGKSTLFNRLLGRRVAIVEDRPGVTRDRLYAPSDWAGREFILVDTGGLGAAPDEELAKAVEYQAQYAIEEADVIVFLVDGQTGPTAGDFEVAELLRKSNKPLLLVVNKIDNLKQEERILEFYSLGLGEPFPLSALNGLNTGDLLDEIIFLLPPEKDSPGEDEVIRVAIIGRPNVGKSSLVNAIIGAERVVTSSIPGTTRDAVDTPFVFAGQKLVLVDTAGLRRTARVRDSTEYYSTLRTKRAIETCDIAVLVLDGPEGVREQDQRIAGYAHEAGRGLIIVVNKWDLLKLPPRDLNYYLEELKRKLAFCAYAPILLVSALTGHHVRQLLDTILKVHTSQKHVLPQADLDTLLADILAMTPPPQLRNRVTRLYRLRQTGSTPPRFSLVASDPEAVHFSYLRRVENRIRGLYPYVGTPLKIRAVPKT